MAEEIVCPVCETVNAAENETCVQCGADLASQMPVDSDDPMIGDTPAGGNEFADAADDFEDFEDAEEYAAQDFHEDPGDVEIEGSPSEQIVGEESGDDDFVEDEFAEFGDSDDVDEGSFPVDDFDDEEFGDEDALYEDGATDPDIQAMGAADEDHTQGDELAQEAAEEMLDNDADEFGEFGGYDDEEVEDEFADFEDESADEDDFAEFADEASEEFEGDDEFAEFGGDQDADQDFEELADDASDELEAQDDLDEFEEEDEGLLEPSEVEPEEPPELAVILNPQREGAEDLADLPTPGPYAEPATLTLFSDRQHVGDLAVSANVLTLGRPAAVESAEVDVDDVEAAEEAPAIDTPDDPGTVELEDELIEEVEADPFDDDDLYDEDISLQGGGQAPAEFEAEDEDDFEDEFAEFEDAPEASEASEVSEAEDDEVGFEESVGSEVAVDDHTGEPVLVDLGQYADADAFADKHSYIFRQNKNYTLYVTSDAGTQLNDEMLDLGEHRELEDGDVIVLGGTLAMRFNLPAAGA